MSNSVLSALANYAINSGIPDAAEYWSRDNAAFEKTNPTLVDRAIRGINPMTAFGTAMGAMHDGAGKGSLTEMGLALLQALPQFGATSVVQIPAQGAIKATSRVSPSVLRTILGTTGGLAASVAVDEAQESNERVR